MTTFRVNVIGDTPRSVAPASRPAVIIVSHVTPWPVRAGNEYRLARLIASMEEVGFDVHLVYRPFLARPLQSSTVADIASHYPRTYAIDIPMQTIHVATDALVAYQAVISMGGTEPQTYEYKFQTDLSELSPQVLERTRAFAPDPVIDLVRRLSEALRPTAVIAEYVFMSRVLSTVPSTTIRMIDMHDVFSSKGDKVVRFGVDDGYSMSRSEEAYLLARADCVMAIQNDEAQSVRRLVPSQRVITVGIDYPVVVRSHSARLPRVLVIGSDNAMNLAGLAGFMRFAWPLVLRVEPRTELAVVGPIAKAMSGAEPNVSLRGTVDDLDVMYASARVALNPAFAGTGIKVKTLEALAHLCPIVVWPSGVDGLSDDVRKCCSIADNWASFGHLVAKHVVEPGRSHLNSRRSLLRQALSTDTTYRELRAILTESQK